MTDLDAKKGSCKSFSVCIPVTYLDTCKSS